MIPRFALRELLWLTLVVGLALGWWIERRALLTAKTEAEGDAKDLSRLTDPTVDLAPWRWSQLRTKYGIPE